MKTKIQQYLSLFFRVTCILFLIVFLFLMCLFFIAGYNSFISFIVEFFNLHDKMNDLKEEYLTPQRFYFLRYFLIGFTILYAGLAYLIIKKSEKLARLTINGFILSSILLSKLFSEINNLSTRKKILFVGFIGIVLLSWVYGMFIYPITNDEVFSYLYLVDKGFIVTSVYYPGPNNHIFYLQLCIMADLFFDDPVLIMRLPALIASLITLLLIFSYLLKRFSFLFATFVSIIFYSFYNIFYYSFHGRGYVLIYLFFILSSFAFIELVNSDKKKFFSFLYITSSVLGFYSIPVFLYPFISLHLVFFLYAALTKNNLLIRTFIISSLIIIALTGLLYLPVILVSGLQSIIGNGWVVPMTFQKFINGYDHYLINTFDYLFDLSFGDIVAFVTFLFGLLLFKGNGRDWKPLFISCLFVPFFILLVQKVYPFFRVWDYMSFIFAMLTGSILLFLINKLKNEIWKKVLSAVFIILILTSGFIHYKMNTRQRFSYYVALNDFMDQVYKKEFNTVYAPDDTYSLFLLYNARLRQRKIELVSDPLKMPDILVIPTQELRNLNINKELYQRYLCNKQACGYIKLK